VKLGAISPNRKAIFGLLFSRKTNPDHMDRDKGVD